MKRDHAKKVDEIAASPAEEDSVVAGGGPAVAGVAVVAGGMAVAPVVAAPVAGGDAATASTSLRPHSRAVLLDSLFVQWAGLRQRYYWAGSLGSQHLRVLQLALPG